MSNNIRQYQRKNAEQIGKAFAKGSIIHGSSGGRVRVENELACAIVEKAITKHMRSSANPTSVRLNLNEALAFPTFRPSPAGCPIAWLVVVSDRAGGLAYAIAQEGAPSVDPQIRAAVAKARAQYQACYILQENKMGLSGTVGCA
ncbi:hypothetical protein [Paracoccus thiocyanatus]|uniref:hypothetical protein n=1 Tax=Paracoccus thiocyanatus TaxID=34006 RepID=UPI0011C07FC9|nr:hypothetical protein [Paracoccus thiocyanatus]